MSGGDRTLSGQSIILHVQRLEFWESDVSPA